MFLISNFSNMFYVDNIEHKDYRIFICFEKNNFWACYGIFIDFMCDKKVKKIIMIIFILFGVLRS